MTPGGVTERLESIVAEVHKGVVAKKDGGMSKREIARRAGLDYDTVDAFIRRFPEGEHAPTYRTINWLAQWLEEVA